MWDIEQTEEFQKWFDESDELQSCIVENIEVLKQLGPTVGRPKGDTLKGDYISNLKELKFKSGKRIIRIFYVFDLDRNRVLLIRANKYRKGEDKKVVQDKMIDRSERVYQKYLREMRN